MVLRSEYWAGFAIIGFIILAMVMTELEQQRLERERIHYCELVRIYKNTGGMFGRPPKPEVICNDV